MGMECSTNGGEEECLWDIGEKIQKEGQDIGGWTILKWILER
jgi:hypothetical protein